MPLPRRDRRRLVALPALALGVLAAALPGCGGDEAEGRIAISGRVTLDGEPLEEGHVTLLPVSGGAAVGGVIEDGAFRIGASEGPKAGPYIVEIDAVRPTGRVVDHPDFPGASLEETASVIPPRYNRRSTLRVEVLADGDNAFEFDLGTR